MIAPFPDPLAAEVSRLQQVMQQLQAQRPVTKFNLDGWVECDTECYPNYWLCKFYMPDGTYREWASYPGKPLDTVGLRAFLESVPGIITFNGMGYDCPMICAALQGYDNQTLKNYNDAIIPGEGKQGVKYWDFYRNYNIPEPTWNHIDIMEVAPGVRLSLKAYGGRAHAPQLQDLPIEPHMLIEPMQRLDLSKYCGNDLRTTRLLKEKIMPRLKLRHDLGERYGIKVMSKSDAQIAESVYKAKLSQPPQRIHMPHGHRFRYQAPEWIKFVSPELNGILQMVQSVDFVVNDASQLKLQEDEKVYDSDGKEIKSGVRMPAEIRGRDIQIGQAKYRLGIGGLHSKEKSISYRAVPGRFTISDHDVNSYYPTLMLLMNMYPPGTGPEFIELLRGLYNERLHAKHMADALEKAGRTEEAAEWKTVSDGLKIVLNGTYGKLGSRWSFLFAPELMIRTTMSGQLALLMLIEMLELSGIRVISANTDGIVVVTARGLESIRDGVIKWWEKSTGLETEATEYTSIHSRDVNNYVAFKPDGKHKAKGIFGESGVSPKASPTGKHPGKDICNEAVIAFLRDGTPIEKTIRTCDDIRKFLVIRAVKGGCVQNVQTTMTLANGATFEHPEQVYLGKVVRWYYGTGANDCLRYKSNGNKVGSSDGAVPMMQLTDEFPQNVNYDFYIDEAKKMLRKLGS